MHDLFVAALLGTIQGLTEFLPVSSTAHLLIGRRVLGFDDPDSVFTIVIQFGSILAVMWLYRARLTALIAGAVAGEARQRRFALALGLACIPAGAAGLFFGDYIKTVLHQSPLVIATALVVGGFVMLAVERRLTTPVVMKADEASVSRALGVGFCQALALVPGVSRSGATIVGGLMMRFDRSAAAEFSFFLAMPTMAAAFAKDLWDVRHALSPDRATEIGVGFVMAFVAALVVVRPFLRVVARSGFAPFAWYRIAIGAAVLGAVALEWM